MACFDQSEPLCGEEPCERGVVQGSLADAFTHPQLNQLFRNRLDAMTHESDGWERRAGVAKQCWERGLLDRALVVMDQLEGLGGKKLDAALAAAPVLEHHGQITRALTWLRHAIEAEPDHDAIAVACQRASELALKLAELGEPRT